MVGLLCFYLVHFKFDVQYQWNIRINYIGPFLSKQRINKGRTVRTRIFWSSNKYIFCYLNKDTLLSVQGDFFYEQRYFVVSQQRYFVIETRILSFTNKDTLLSEQSYFVIRTRIQYFAIRTRLPCYPNKDTFNYFVIQTRKRCYPNKNTLFSEQRYFYCMS